MSGGTLSYYPDLLGFVVIASFEAQTAAAADVISKQVRNEVQDPPQYL